MNLKFSLVAMLAVACCVSLTSAQDAAKEKGAEQCTGGCPVAAAMENLPKMTFKVGEEATCCNVAAEALAKKSDAPIQFVVGKTTFDNKEAAFTSLVEETESFVKEFMTPCKCEVSGQTSIAGKSCGCPVEAGKRAELVSTAAAKVTMSYAVGEKTCNCPVEAANLAKTSGAKKEFVVAGEKTCCEMTARLNLARAKYKAAVEALAAAEKKTEKAGS